MTPAILCHFNTEIFTACITAINMNIGAMDVMHHFLY